MSAVTAFCLLCTCVLASVLLCTCSPPHEDSDGEHRHKRSLPTLSNRTHCGPGEQWPATRVNTTQRLADLRAEMSRMRIDAFIILSGDAHGSEYTAARDQRRGFISGFTGSAGYAAVTMTQAALWTDGRYFLEAEDAMDCNWIFMKRREPGVPTMPGWLTTVLTAGQSVGADPFLVTNSLWQDLERSLQKVNVTLTAVATNPVDAVWSDQPQPPRTPVNALDVRYAGKSWQDKVGEVYTAMQERGVNGAYVVTSLDEVAWLFNLRATDIEYNPFFISYAVVEYYGQSSADNKVRLYLYDKERRLTADPTDDETSANLHTHLNTNPNGTCTGLAGLCVQVQDYNSSQVAVDISMVAAASSDNKVWVTFDCNYAIFDAVPQAQRFQERSFIALAKAQKNPTERHGMDVCNKRDAVVLVEFLAKMEREITEGKNWTEVSASAELKRMRQAADKNRGLSFASIAGSGPNGAVMHYRPGPMTDRQLTTDEMFLLDSGGQYLECTTDTTRTMHYGTPTPFMIEAYTRVLMGAIDLARVVWRKGLYGRSLDILARQNLWSAGLDYNHGTGHGIGAYLSVHEEPGYYQDGEFGVRLETVLMVEPLNTTHQFGTAPYMHFQPVALVPFEPKLIDFTLLSTHQIEWLNHYNELTRDHILPLLTSDLAKDWLRERTRPYVTPTPPCRPPSSSSSSRLHTHTSTFPPLLLAALALTLLSG
ncbi:xaa-Pro aminopeptidase 1-like isoform X2 [Babylonia areolata]|uniref:xaa-Pro aminopeptidase 1-like isoform X2 n=1 Tax=Babylonia areolata TaxID=304850 RepID=UPI003FCF3BD5